MQKIFLDNFSLESRIIIYQDEVIICISYHIHLNELMQILFQDIKKRTYKEKTFKNNNVSQSAYKNIYYSINIYRTVSIAQCYYILSHYFSFSRLVYNYP